MIYNKAILLLRKVEENRLYTISEGRGFDLCKSGFERLRQTRETKNSITKHPLIVTVTSPRVHILGLSTVKCTCVRGVLTIRYQNCTVYSWGPRRHGYSTLYGGHTGNTGCTGDVIYLYYSIYCQYTISHYKVLGRRSNAVLVSNNVMDGFPS